MTAIVDSMGQKFYTGLIPPETGFVSAHMPLEKSITLLTDDEIQALLADPSRTPDDQIFPDYFIARGDQKQHNSCAGWGGANAFSETAYLNGDRLPDNSGEVYSGSYPYSGCNRGRDAGAMLEDVLGWIQNKGMVPASVCDSENIWRQNTIRFDAQALKNRGIALHTIKSQAEMNTALARRQIVVCVINVDRSSRYVNYRGQGLVPEFGGSGNHCIRCRDIRWNAAARRYEYKQAGNWGLGWGQRGTGWCTWASFSQTINNHTFYTLTFTARFS